MSFFSVTSILETDYTKTVRDCFFLDFSTSSFVIAVLVCSSAHYTVFFVYLMMLLQLLRLSSVEWDDDMND
jgi:hypothetical protein